MSAQTAASRAPAKRGMQWAFVVSLAIFLSSCFGSKDDPRITRKTPELHVAVPADGSESVATSPSFTSRSTVNATVTTLRATSRSFVMTGGTAEVP